MRRRLSLIEGTMYGDGQTAVNVVAAVKIRGNVNVQELEIAFAKIQARHPLLMVNVVEGECGIPYFVTDENIRKIPIRVSNRYTDEDWKKETTSECLSSFDVKNGPLIRAVCLKSALASDLILVCHHCICDGKAILNLLDETLRILGQPQTEIGSYHSYGSLQDFIPAAVKNKKSNQLMAFLVEKLVKLALLMVSSKKEVKRVKPFLLHWKLDQKESAVVLEKCKAEGLSPHAILSVVFLKAFGRIQSIKSYAKLYCAVDMRRFLPDIKDDMLFAFPAMIGLRLKGGRTIDCWDQARLLKKELLLKINKMNVNKVFLLGECLLPALSKITKYAKADVGAHDFTFSNIGKTCIKENYGAIEVERVYSHVSIFPFGNPSTIFASVFRGQLDFIITSDEYFLKYEDAVAVKDKAMELLASACRCSS
ncbi:hypothetical protein H7F33_04965 [Pedobacter sp. PAMC26386]|nr:hypothetical protein H7F33_04965 [Pedobacter sp. PAMC26386]